jgi:hypothetical protein
MGCDIHLFTERKRYINGQEKWYNIDNWKLNPYYENNEDSETKYNVNYAYHDRNYDLFSILADVRGDRTPISEAKGLPEDVSDVVKAESDNWGSDGHSHSYFTMEELYSYFEQNRTVTYSGYVTPEGSEKIDAGEMPDFWFTIRSDRAPIEREWEFENVDIKHLIEVLEKHFKSEYYRKDTESEKFRIVFWFDN